MKNSQITRGVVLEVPYVEKDEAKHLGARWDAEIKGHFGDRHFSDHFTARHLRMAGFGRQICSYLQ